MRYGVFSLLKMSIKEEETMKKNRMPAFDSGSLLVSMLNNSKAKAAANNSNLLESLCPDFDRVRFLSVTVRQQLQYNSQ